MEFINVTRKEFDHLKALQEKRGWSWPAVFSTNPSLRVFPPPRKGFTREADREYVEGQSNIIDQVASACVHVRRRGGRFFINEDGAFFKEHERGPYTPFVWFRFRD